MSERRRRVVLWLVALALSVLLFIPKGHETPPGGAPLVAFLHGAAGTTTVRLAGDVPHPGVYEIASPGTVRELVSQAVPDLVERLGAGNLTAPLADGDVVTVTVGNSRDVTIVRGAMPARERIVLGIPLDPARMTAADWEALPGIGPAMTARIMAYARQRGGLRSVDDLLGVEGIGERTIEKLRPLFNPKTTIAQ